MTLGKVELRIDPWHTQDAEYMWMYFLVPFINIVLIEVFSLEKIDQFLEMSWLISCRDLKLGRAAEMVVGREGGQQ